MFVLKQAITNNEVEDLVAKSFEVVQRKIFCYSKAIYIIKMTTVIKSMKVFSIAMSSTIIITKRH